MDDILVTGSSGSINHLISNLNKAFLLKDLRHMNCFLGIQVSTLSDGNIHRSQRKYITDLLPRAKMQYAISVSTAMFSGQKLTTYGSDSATNTQSLEVLWEPYNTQQCSIRSCRHLGLRTDCSINTQLFRYLADTLDSRLTVLSNLNSSMTLEGFCDAVSTSHPDDRKLTSVIMSTCAPI